MTRRDPDGAIMAPGHMAGSTTQSTHTDQDELEAAGLYSPPVRPSRARRPPAWLTALQSHERKWWSAALAATLLISATAVGLLYADDMNKQATIHSLQTSNESLTGRALILNDQLKKVQTNLTATLDELARTKAQLDHPQLSTWSSPMTIKDNMTVIESPVPDAFTLHLQLTSTGPINVSILTLDQYVAARECVSNRVAVTNWCMHHQNSEVSFLDKTSVNYDFHKAEGCADYIVVITSASAVTITPNVSVTYNPASGPTGTCA